jgi:gluconate 2-dehydrogenase gamma chain
MKRRDTLKAISLSSFGLAAFPTTALVSPPDSKKKVLATPGRVLNEAERDAKLLADTFFTPSELKLLTSLVDIIIPQEGNTPSASKVGVPAFIEFMAKDKPELQTPLRGGLRWMDHEANKRFGYDFINLSYNDQIKIIDDIAYPDDIPAGMSQGVAFFTNLRGLTLTGFYTTQVGFDDLGYVGNRPNQWEGVPQDVLTKYGI